MPDRLCPDYSTIALFRTKNRRALLKVFRLFVWLCAEVHPRGTGRAYIDGTAIRAVSGMDATAGMVRSGRGGLKVCCSAQTATESESNRSVGFNATDHSGGMNLMHDTQKEARRKPGAWRSPPQGQRERKGHRKPPAGRL